MIDVNTFIGEFPFRAIPSPTPQALVSELDRQGRDSAWVGHLPSVYHRDVSPGNDALYTMLEPFAGRLKPVPAVRPDWPDWEETLTHATQRGAAAVRAYPSQWQMGPHHPGMTELTQACGDARLPLILTVRFEDLRQRHPLDVAGDLTAAHIRHLARVGENARLVVTAAGKDMIEEVHWGLTPEEQGRVWWDISWIWGPPEDHLARLLRTIGAERFVYGSQWPLRLSENPQANLELLPNDLRSATLADPGDLFRDVPA